MSSTAEKVCTLEVAAQKAVAAQAKGLKVVTTNGCFDLLHPGHLAYLEEARALGDLLFVGINSDQSVKANKGDLRPVNSAKERALLMAALAFVDTVFIFEEKDPRAFIRELKPAIHVKGGDYSGRILEQDEVESHGGVVKLLPFVPGYSTTSLIERIHRAYHLSMQEG